MMLAIPENSENNLSEQLEAIDGIKFYLTETKKLPTHNSPTHAINLSGGDNEGIVHANATGVWTIWKSKPEKFM